MRKALTLFSILLLTACSQQLSNNQEPIKIGGLFGLTGFVSFAGEASHNGFIMAFEDAEIRSVAYVVEDFQSDFTTVATAAKKLIDVDNVSVVIGPEWKEFSEIIGPIATENNTLFISPWMTGESFISNYYLSATASERGEVRRTLTYMKEKGHRRFALVYSNNAWSLGYIAILKDEVKKDGSFEIVNEFKLEQDAKDYRTEITKIRQRSPDAIYSVLATDNGEGVFGKQLIEMDTDMQRYVPHVRGSSDVFSGEFSDAAEGVIYAAPKPNPNMEKFSKKYRDRFGKEPTAISAATSYDMTTLVLRAIKEGARSADDIRAYLLDLDGYEGYSNTIRFDETGHVGPWPVIMKQIKDGQRVTLSD